MAPQYPQVSFHIFAFCQMKDDEAMRPCVHQHGSTAFFIEVQDFLFHCHGSQWNWRLVIPLFQGAMLNPFPKEMSSYSTIQPSNTQISDSTDNRMEHMLLKMEDSQRQHQHTLLQVLHIVPRRNFSKMFFSHHPSLSYPSYALLSYFPNSDYLPGNDHISHPSRHFWVDDFPSFRFGGMC